jgi:antirestriction protein ArdC
MSEKVKRDLYLEVTQSIIASLEAGVAPWVRPWGGSGLPVNATSNVAYRGLNVLLLWCAARRHGFTSDRWLTFRQAQTVGGSVRKGERGTLCVKYLMAERKTKNDDGTVSVERYPVLSSFTVFNVEQCDALPGPVVHGAADAALMPVADLERWFGRLGARVVPGAAPRYLRESDHIEMPELGQFHSPEGYYSVLAHEHVHWSGHESRCARPLAGRYDDPQFAYEALVSEMGSAFVCAQLGLENNLQHPQYIGAWLQRLADDKRLVFKAAREARLAVEYLNALIDEHPETVAERDAEVTAPPSPGTVAPPSVAPACAAL